ncbi:MAG TPA: carcinine hydrolase/isopenicillin-N N-acyltransferase family protein, partial [Abditibacteriaceae bacterium]
MTLKFGCTFSFILLLMGEPVFVYGSAAEVGAVQGRWQRAVLQERVERTLQRAQHASLTDILRKRAERFGLLLSEAAPHWLGEAHSIAAEAGIEAWHLLAINTLPPVFWGESYQPAPLSDARLTQELIDVYETQGIDPGLGEGECTAFFALGSASISGETVFHKNRDELDEVQCLYIKHIDGYFRFVGGGDIGNLGAAHVHSENFWVGANNTGSAILPNEYQDGALNDAHVLRYLAEKCPTLDALVPAVEELIEKSWLGGGAHECGSIWLFADAERGLIIEATSRRMAYQWFDGDETAVRSNHFLLPGLQPFALASHPGSVRRLERATELWDELNGVAGISAAVEIGRDRDGAPHAICRNPADGLGSVTVSTAT